MFTPIFPIYIAALWPLHCWAPLVWLGGVVLLWLTRYTHPLGVRWGWGYYALSAILRPAGVVLIAVGWLALYAPLPGYRGRPLLFGRAVGWLPRQHWADGVWWVAIVASLALGLWALAGLGLRRSFLYRHVDDRLVTGGAYALVRHPQFLSALAVTFFGIRLFNPAGVALDPGAYRMLDANWVLLALALWLLAVLEDRELAAHYGASYQAYAREVPRLFPTRGPLWAALGRWLAPARRGLAQCTARLAGPWTSPWALVEAVARLAGIALIVVGGLTVVVAARQAALEGAPREWLRPGRCEEVLMWLGTAGSIALGAWSFAALGWRGFLSWRTPGERLVTRGPYALVRHPQFLAAIGMALLATRPFDPWPREIFILGRYYRFGEHWLPFALALWALAWLEDRALARRFPAEHQAYAQRVPRLFPN